MDTAMIFLKRISLAGGLAIGAALSTVLAQPALAEMTPISWYGPGFEGNYTASGEQFDRWGYTAAHPSMPFGTLLELTNPDNGSSVTVRINDRSGGLLDISEQAAIDLGVRNEGLARVSVDIVRWGR
ncbi:MAG: septal ring lytic transglycosylase RlpA family protein [Cyanobacteria bacterium P01_A01_bin.114]